MPNPVFSHAAVFRDTRPFIMAAQNITATATVTTGDEIIPVDGTSAGFTLTLPLATTRRGRQIYIVKVDAVNNVTVSRQGTDVIGFAGGTTVTLNTQDQVLHLVSDGATRWLRLQG